jgi:hypothetical protein
MGGADASPPIDIRLSMGDENDRRSIDRLACEAGTASPEGAVLLAEIDGEPVAAVGFADGRAVSHPSRSHPAILQYLRLRRLEAYLIGSIWGG